jgi:hypothetical protein
LTSFRFVRAPINSPDDLLRVITRVRWCTVYLLGASIPISVRTKQASPMAHFPEGPSFRFGIFNCCLDLFFGCVGLVAIVRILI